MKYLLVLLVVVIGLWALFGRGRRQAEPPPAPRPQSPAVPATMLACAHCGVHLPRDDAVVDTAGLAYCGDAHRLAGPR